MFFFSNNNNNKRIRAFIFLAAVVVVSEQRHSIATPLSTFTLIQFADLHLGENEFIDRKALRVVRSVLVSQTPDLIVFSGDQLSGWLMADYWVEAKRALGRLHEAIAPTPCVFILGNHDDQPFMLDPMVWYRWLNRLLALFALSLLLFLFCMRGGVPRRLIACLLMLSVVCALALYSVTPDRRAYHRLQQEPDTGSNDFYHLVRFTSTQQQLLLFFMDSGGGRQPEQVYDAQIVWMRRVQLDHRPAVTLVFMHIPLPEYASLCASMGGERPSPVQYERFSFYEALLAMGVKAIFAGHDHANAWCCVSVRGPALCYGMQTGYGGGYGPKDGMRGARVIRVHAASDNNNNTISIATWLQLENGATRAYLEIV